MSWSTVDWSCLFHAYGRAGDVPAQLAALVGTNGDEAFDASVFVIQKLFASGTLTPATAPAMRAVVELLHEPALGAGDDSVRDALLWFVGDIARVTTSADVGSLRGHLIDETAATAWADEQFDDPNWQGVFDWRGRGLPGTALLDRALADCFDLLPDMFGAIWPIPSWWRPWSRVMATAAAVMLVRHPGLADRQQEVIAHHETAAGAAEDRRECASYLLGLGELGVSPTRWLGDPRLGVRVCAALAPSLASDGGAIAVLVEAAEHPRAFDNGFSEPFVPPAYRLMLPTFRTALWPHEILIGAVCERVNDFSRLVRAAVAAVDLRGVYRPTPKFGPYLGVAFPDGPYDSGAGTAEQRAFARAIADRDELWNGSYHGVAEMFESAGLPTVREAWQGLAALPTGDTNYESARIVVFESRATVRRYPSMYLGMGRTDPALIGCIAEIIAQRAGASVQIGPDSRMTVDMDLDVEDPVDLDTVATSRALGGSSFGLAVAAALSLWVETYSWKDGQAYRREYVDGVPTGPLEPFGHAERVVDGYRFVFDLDREWLPPRRA